VVSLKRKLGRAIVKKAAQNIVQEFWEDHSMNDFFNQTFWAKQFDDYQKIEMMMEKMMTAIPMSARSGEIPPRSS